MSATVHSLRLIGMIPRPDDEYRAALLSSVESLRSALTEEGIDPSRMMPMPTRMWPVALDANGRAFALVSMCNKNARPSAVPLSQFFPEVPTKPGALPDTFISVAGWEANHPSSAGVPPDVPGVTVPIDHAMPQQPPDEGASASTEAEHVASIGAQEQIESESLDQAARTAGASGLTAPPKLELGLAGESPSSAADGDAQVLSPKRSGSSALSSGSLSDSPTKAGSAEAPAESKKLNHAQRVARSSDLPKPFDFKTDLACKSPPPTEDETHGLMKDILPCMKARGTVGEMTGALLGIMAQQNASVGSANFHKLIAEKATALQLGSSVYQRLQEALKTFDQIKEL